MPIGARPYATHWQDWVNLLLGLWLFISPWVAAYAHLPGAAWTSWMFGLVIMALAAAALIQFARWQEWLLAAAGLWLIVSPWVVGFTEIALTRPVWNHVVIGLLVGTLSLWTGLAYGRSKRLP